ncbi:LysR family transcriptional regulator [Pyxidicoccus parkwayensis]|uniref:LysR family transcriptional regulator n=1 Tax=Pyxidicoccus parkwayensis TaxID=2813578 RepID=A0ABX7NL03_9BACT|nr:LysR family transcriptional regulator [Pyxidicoccus parkwaysis]QSQ19059.1 LysR family transcriptional regulator [Pyxidicoccus parkwaysis]
MNRSDLADLSAFTLLAAEGSFTRAAARLGMSQSALSHAMKALEQRLGVRLLSRTTRSVATTEAGEELLRTLRPAFDDIAAGLEHLGTKRAKPAGTVRLTMIKQAAVSLIRPMLPGFLATYPDIQVEVDIDDGFTDIVAQRFDAGIRFGEQVAKDMVAVRVGPDIRAAVVASPAYLAARPAPRTPRELASHRCINYRLATARSLYAWEFEEDGRRFKVRVEGSLVFNDGDLIEAAVLDGHGIGYLWEPQVTAHIASGRLVRLLEEWCPPLPGFFLYYPSRRQTPPALAAFIQALRAGSRSGAVPGRG